VTRAVLATLATADFVPMAQQLFAGAHTHGAWQGDYLLLAVDIPADRLAWFTQRGIHVVECSDVPGESEWGSLPFSAQFHRAVMAKFRLFTPAMKRCQQVVYMDADILIRAPLLRLAGRRGFFATPDSLVLLAFQFAQGQAQHALAASGYDGNAIPFCSGMFAFSTERIEDSSYQTLQALSQRFLAHSTRPDQAILNLFCYRDWQPLSVSYALLLRFIPTGLLCSRASQAIALHFAGPGGKPWSPESPYHREWQHNLKTAQHIDFTTPAPITYAQRVSAWRRDVMFVSWFVPAKRLFIRSFRHRRWYPAFRRWAERFC
jgi:lipopolysaccharide biosynthesis glycosyltransferase